MQNLRYVLRSLKHEPWYVLAVTVLIGLGFALLGSVFAVVDGVLFKPLGYPGESQLFAIRFSSNREKGTTEVSAGNLVALAAAAPGVAFTGFRAQPSFDSNDPVNTAALGRAQVQASFFDVIGVRPAVGGFLPEDFEPTSSRIEPRVVTEEVFRSRFGADSTVIGRTIVADPTSGFGYRIVGVMPRGFVFPSDAVTVGYLAPYRGRANSGRDFPEVIARAPSGANPVQAIAQLSSLATLAAGAKDEHGDPAFDRVEVHPLSTALGARSRPLFEGFLAAAALLVGVAVLNASALMTARTLNRVNELSIRQALGASVIALGKLMLLESLVLIGLGAAFAIVTTTTVLGYGLHLLPTDLVLFRSAAIDSRVLTLIALGWLLLGVIASIWPLNRSLKVSRMQGKAATHRGRPFGWRSVIAVQVAAALVLTITGALFVSSVLSVYGEHLELTAKGVVTIEAHFLGTGSAGRPGRLSPERAMRVDAVIDGLRAIPGVDWVGATSAELLDGGSSAPRFKLPATASRGRLNTDMQAVTADYYRVVQLHVVAGRLPSEAELADNSPVVVVSEAVARKYWPDANAVGQTLQDSGDNGADGRLFTVVGVVKDVRWWSWDQESAQIYGPYALLSRSPLPTFVLRTSTDPDRITKHALDIIETVDPLLKPIRAKRLDDLFVDSIRARRFQAWLFGSFAITSLCVAGIGIFGQMAMASGRRSREVGIRLACGATPAKIVGLLLREQLLPVAVGFAGGGLVALWAAGLAASYLYHLSAYDRRVWAVAAAFMFLAALTGALVPAVRTSGTDPMAALRED